MQPQLSKTSRILAGALLLAISLGVSTRDARAGPAPVPDARADDGKPLQLDVFVNGKQIQTLGSFTQGADGHLSASRSEMKELGVRVPGDGAPSEVVSLSSIRGLEHRYEERSQSVHLTVPDDLRAAKDYNADLRDEERPKLRGGTGAVLNYNLLSTALRSTENPNVTFQGGSATLDARIFSPIGTINQSAILGSTTLREVTALRLETTWSYSNPDSMVTYKVGDTVSSGLAWTRPIRIGGVQMQRNFGLRSDLVTLPLPVISGSAAVPSTLDVYVNNVRTFSQNVDTGPYRITNLPMIGGDGTARVVLRDAAGHQVEQTMPFFASARLLKPGLMDYSLEAGYARRYFGSDSNSYDNKPLATGSLRRGIYDWLTLEGHGETAQGFGNVGIGATARVMERAIVSGAVAGSTTGKSNGLQVYGSLETKMFGVTMNFTTQRTFGNYDDLASITAATAPRTWGSAVSSGGSLEPYAVSTSLRPPKSLDRVSFSVPLVFDKSNVGLSFTRMVASDGKRSTIASASWSRAMPWNSSVFVTAYSDISTKNSAGIFVGISAPLGGKASVSTGVATTGKDWSINTSAARPLGLEPGSYGWRIQDSETSNQGAWRSAAASYRSPYGKIEGGVTQNKTDTRGSLEIDGAISTLGGGFYLSDRIHDAFAVVDAGAANVDVLYENRRIGTTNGSGRLLVPSLRSYQRNRIAIDPRNLPVDAEVPTTQDVVAPLDRGGVLVNFGVRTTTSAAIVILTGADGKFLPAGTPGKLEGSSETFVVGYDGRAFIANLGAQNNVSATIGMAECKASFAYTPSAGTQVTVGPVACR